jgi:ribose transport system permease protein
MSTIRATVKKVPGIMWGAIAIVVVFAFVANNFISLRNIQNILDNTATLIIVSLGMTLTILSGQIDMSIGGVMSASGMIAAIYMKSIENPTTIDIIITIAIGLAVGLAFGLFNGFMIGKLKYNYWLITFATLSIGYGLAQAVTNGNILAGFSKDFRNVAGGKIFGISTIIYIALIITIVMVYMSRRKRLGMHIYAVGDSEVCATLSGINVVKTRFQVYLISGALAGLGGVLLMSKTNSASALSGDGYEFDAIAAAIVGGTPFEGGKGGLVGTVVGALLIEAVKSGLQLIGLSTYWQQTFVGLFILLVIVFDVINSTRKKTAAMRRIYRDE